MKLQRLKTKEQSIEATGVTHSLKSENIQGGFLTTVTEVRKIKEIAKVLPKKNFNLEVSQLFSLIMQDMQVTHE